MTKDDIIRMARIAEMGFDMTMPAVIMELERFAALVAAAEREACAKVAEAYKEDCYAGDLDWYVVKYIVDEIKARGKE
jgi:uncharacterized membrane protein